MLYPFLMFNVFFYLLFCFFMTIHIIFFINKSNMAIHIILSILCILSLIYEFVQMCTFGFDDYFFGGIWNYFDLGGFIFTLAYLFMSHPGRKNTLIFADEFLLMGVICILLRGVSQLRAFTPTRYLVRMIMEIVYDMTAFMLVLFISIFGFTILF